jgi:hypothetical protein
LSHIFIFLSIIFAGQFLLEAAGSVAGTVHGWQLMPPISVTKQISSKKHTKLLHRRAFGGESLIEGTRHHVLLSWVVVTN